jgi:hypothetical protein
MAQALIFITLYQPGIVPFDSASYWEKFTTKIVGHWEEWRAMPGFLVVELRSPVILGSFGSHRLVAWSLRKTFAKQQLLETPFSAGEKVRMQVPMHLPRAEDVGTWGLLGRHFG